MKKLLVVLSLLPLLSWGQDYRATLTGQITDQSHAPVPQATVKAVKQGTNETKETKTNSEGIYTLPYLDPGDYTVEISAAGFNNVRRAISLRVADKLNLSQTLEVGAITEQVTVSAE